MTHEVRLPPAPLSSAFREHVAYHEAGHALTAILLGVPFQQVALAPVDAPPEAAPGWLKGWDHSIPNDPPERREAARLGLLAIHYGGLMGEIRSPHWETFQGKMGCRTDLELLEALLTEWYPDPAKRKAMRQEALFYSENVWRTCYSAETIATWLKRLVEALLQHETLTYAQAIDAINHEAQEGEAFSWASTEEVVHTAYHEAGHALMWILLGVPFEEASIVPDANGGAFVTGGYPTPDAPPEARQAAHLGMLAIGWGGLIGEIFSPHWATHQSQEGWKHDLEQNRAWIAEWYPEASPAEQQAMYVEGERLAYRLMGTPPTDNIGRLRRLAQALLQYRTITYQQAVDTIEAQKGEDPTMGLFQRTPPHDSQDDLQDDPQADQQDTAAPGPAPVVDKYALRAQERRERRAEKEQRRREQREDQQQRREARLALRQQRRQERRETARAVAHRAEAWWQGRRAPKPEPTPLERYRKRIESFEEDRETLPEKAVRWVFLGLAYVLPFNVALSIGKEIGDAYSGTTDYWASGWSIGTHTVAYAGELALAMMVLSTAAALRRYKADSSYTAKLVSSIFFFLVFVVASSLAQWFIAEQHIHPKTHADLAALIFRVVMPPAVDVASMLYLAIMGYKSLKKFLAEENLKADAIRLLNEAEIKIQEAQQQAERRQKEAEQALAMKERRENLLLRIEEIHSQAMIDTAQQALLPGRRDPVRIEESPARDASRPLSQMHSEGSDMPAITGAFQEFSADENGHANNGRHPF